MRREGCGRMGNRGVLGVAIGSIATLGVQRGLCGFSKALGGGFDALLTVAPCRLG